MYEGKIQIWNKIYSACNLFSKVDNKNANTARKLD